MGGRQDDGTEKRKARGSSNARDWSCHEETPEVGEAGESRLSARDADRRGQGVTSSAVGQQHPPNDGERPETRPAVRLAVSIARDLSRTPPSGVPNAPFEFSLKTSRQAPPGAGAPCREADRTAGRPNDCVTDELDAWTTAGHVVILLIDGQHPSLLQRICAAAAAEDGPAHPSLTLPARFSKGLYDPRKRQTGSDDEKAPRLLRLAGYLRPAPYRLYSAHRSTRRHHRH
ncbi:hypothetical protein M432DRAFT_638287 [Thermoascus aurantiacus ATCC 26904]